MSYGFPQTTPGYSQIRPASSLAGTTTNPFAPSSYAATSSPFPPTYARPPDPAPTGFPAYSTSFPSNNYGNQRPASGFPPAFPAPQTTSPFQSAGFPPSSNAFPSTYQPASSAPAYGTAMQRYKAIVAEGAEGYIQHITTMPGYDAKSTEELRLEDYVHNKAKLKPTPAPPFAGTNPFANNSYSYSSYRQPAPQPGTSVFSPTPTTSSFFANPSTYPQTSAFASSSPFQQPSPFPAFPSAPAPTQNPFAASTSAFTANSATPTRTSFFPSYTPTQYPAATNPPATTSYPAFIPPASSTSNPFAAAATAFTPQPSHTTPAAPTFFVQQPAQPFAYSVPRPTTPQNFAFTPQPVANPAITDTHTMVQAYRDPVGLSWLFPNGVPDELLQNRQSRSALTRPTSVVEQILRSKSPVTSSFNSLNMTERWRRNRERRDFSPVRARTEARASPLRNEASIFSKRVATSIKFEAKAGEQPSLQLSPQKHSLQVQVRAYAPDLIQRTLDVDRRERVADLIERVETFVRPQPRERLELVYRGRKLQSDELLADLGLSSAEEVTVLIEPESSKPTSLLPKLTKKGYVTVPSMAALSRMTAAELQRVRNFAVKNEHGEVLFEGETDVTGLDLDEIVEIEAKAVVLYPEKGAAKPLVGRGLNKEALVRLFNCRPKKESSVGDFERKIRKVCERNGSEFVSYCSETGEWVFRAPHF